VRDNEMGERRNTEFWLESWGGDCSEDQVVDRKILDWIIKEIRWEGVGWVHLVWDGHRWRLFRSIETKGCCYV
jgi:hypothetical protein